MDRWRILLFFSCVISIWTRSIIAEDLSAPTSAQSTASEVRSLTRVQVKTGSKPLKNLEGYLIGQDRENGGCLLIERDGRLNVIVASEMQNLTTTPERFEPWSHEQIAAALLKELPKGFRTITSKNYVIAFNTSEAYAKWNISLYERLHRGFINFWKSRGVKLNEPEFPLVAVVFEHRDGYLRYAQSEDVKNAESMIGYYNLLSNRIASYDLTGLEGLIQTGERVNSLELINAILQRPAAERAVATIVHEAVHQLAYNSGLQTRLADNPVAISEGLAMFFETPDLKSPSGWGGIGKVNQYNNTIFRNAAGARATKSIAELIQDDRSFHDASTVSVAYGQSWALTYFLMKARSKEYAAYLVELSRRPPLEPTDPKLRLSEFQKHFGSDLEKLERDFHKYMATVR